MRLVTFLLLGSLSALLVGCVADIPSRPEPGKQYRLGLKGAWSPSEYAELVAACAAWKTFTNGKLDCVVTGGDDVDGYFANEPVDDAVYAKLSVSTRSIVIDVERMKRDGWSTKDIGAMARNMMGQVAGVPLHSAPGVMSQADVTRDFTQADLESVCKTEWCPT